MTATPQRARRAAAAVELALLLPILALLFAAVVDFARAYRAAQVLQVAANDGASYATGTAWCPTADAPTPAAQAAAATAGVTLPLPLSADQLALARAEGAKAAAVAGGASLDPPLRADQVAVTTAGNATTVTIAYDFPLFCGFLFPDGVQLRRTATARTAPNPFQ